MSDLAIHIIAICGIISVAIGVASWIRVEKVERKLFAVERTNKIIDYSLTNLDMRFSRLESQFTELVYKHDPDLWIKFGFTEPADYEKYREAARKIDQAMHLEMGDTEKRMAEIANDLDSIGNKPSRRLKPELKPEDFYLGYIEPAVLATYPDLAPRMKRGSKAWLLFVLDDLRRKRHEARGERDGHLKVGMEFCEMLLKNEPTINKLAANSSAQDSFIGYFTSQLGGAPKAIDHAHEIEVLRRFLYTRRTDNKKLGNSDPSFVNGAIGWSELEDLLGQAKEGKFVHWIETKYNTQCQPHAQINTRKEADRV